MLDASGFTVLHTSGSARAGRLELAHGSVLTPAFMPVGTYGAVKSATPEEVKESGSQILLGNTYHLYLRPGLEVLKKFGGLHRFMHWDGPILTDSGGFQIFSLASLKKVTPEGVHFRSHINGDKHFLTPELAAEIQQTIGSDIAMVLDELVPTTAPLNEVEAAVERSLVWAKRFVDVPRLKGQRIFGIVQGGLDISLRLKSLAETAALPLDGLAIGGLSVGEPHSEMVRILEALAPHLPASVPHYLMGVGTPLDLIEGVRNGVDMFDCVLPTRNGRNGGFFTDEGLLNIRNHSHLLDERPIAENCGCPCCRNYSRSYLRHLFRTQEILGCRLATLHNLHYYHALMSEMRDSIMGGKFDEYFSKKQPQLKVAYGSEVESLEGSDLK